MYRQAFLLKWMIFFLLLILISLFFRKWKVIHRVKAQLWRKPSLRHLAVGFNLNPGCLRRPPPRPIHNPLNSWEKKMKAATRSSTFQKTESKSVPLNLSGNPAAVSLGPSRVTNSSKSTWPSPARDDLNSNPALSRVGWSVCMCVCARARPAASPSMSSLWIITSSSTSFGM